LAVVALALTAAKPRKGKKNAPEPVVVPVVEVVPEPEPEPPPTYAGELWTGELPLDLGELPAGLPSASAQGCAGCHYGTHADWATSSHATAWASGDLHSAFEEAGTPACGSCHQPLRVQHAEIVTYDQGDINTPILAPNEHWDPTLGTEGVTCVACHVRDGAVLTARPIENAPHPTLYAPALSTSEACASCHQLSWPGADKPFYDTFGEWKGSAHADAGLQCQDCHMRPGASEASLGSNHAFAAAPQRAVSVLVGIDRATAARGGDPLAVTITLQNTGAGHSFPTGSPYVGVRVEAVLEVTTAKGTKQQGDVFVYDLVRTLESEPPWNTSSDTRLAAGGTQILDWQAAVPQKAPTGDWSLVVRLTRTVVGDARGEPFVEQRIPLHVD